MASMEGICPNYGFLSVFRWSDAQHPSRHRSLGHIHCSYNQKTLHLQPLNNASRQRYRPYHPPRGNTDFRTVERLLSIETVGSAVDRVLHHNYVHKRYRGDLPHWVKHIPRGLPQRDLLDSLIDFSILPCFFYMIYAWLYSTIPSWLFLGYFLAMGLIHASKLSFITTPSAHIYNACIIPILYPNLFTCQLDYSPVRIIYNTHTPS